MTTRSDQPVLVGRERERRRLLDVVDRVVDGQGTLLLVSGEAGIGKTSLVQDLIGRVAGRDLLVLSGGAYEVTTTPPYGPWVEIIRSIPEAGGFPAVPEQLRVGGGMAGIDSQAALFELSGRYLASVAAVKPVLILLEDLHWADPASLDLLRYLSRELTGVPALLIATYRDDEITLDHHLYELLPAMLRESRVERLSLLRLEREEVASLVRERYRLLPVDEDRLLNYLDRLAEGNPFFINELLYALTERQIIRPVPGGWTLGDLDGAALPPVIQQVINGRLARIDTGSRVLLEAAAVVGYDVPLDLLRRLHDGSDEAMDLALQQVLDHHLISLQARESSARFSHALVRQTIYEAIPPLRRQTLHQRVGDMLASRSRPDLSSVANHLYEAGDERAVEWLAQAAAQAQSLFAPQSVIGHTSRGIELANRLGIDAPLGLYRLRGLARESLGDFNEARIDHETVLERARERSDHHAEWQALLELGKLWASRNYEQAVVYYEQALQHAKQTGYAPELANSHNLIGNWLANVERHHESELHHQQALDIFQELDDRSGVAATYDLLGLNSLLAGQMVKASLYYEEAVARFRELNDQPSLAQALGNLALSSGGGPTYHLFIDPARRDVIAPAANEARQIAGEIGWKAVEAYTTAMAAQPLIAHGDYQKALDTSFHGLELAEAIGHSQWICYTRQNLGDLYYDLLMPEIARQYLESSVPIADTIGSIVWRSWGRCSLALIYLEQNEVNRASALVDELEDLDGREVSCATLYQMYVKATLARAAGDFESALVLIDRLIAADPAGRGNEAPKTLLLYGEILVGLERYDDAAEKLEAAASYSAVLGYRRFCLWRSRALLARLHLAGGRTDAAREAADAALQIVNELAGGLDDDEMRVEFLDNARAQFPGTPPYAPDQVETVGRLTPREMDVLACMSRGNSDREIADELSISPRTVQAHVSNILGKLEVGSRTAAVALAIREGLV